MAAAPLLVLQDSNHAVHDQDRVGAAQQHLELVRRNPAGELQGVVQALQGRISNSEERSVNQVDAEKEVRSLLKREGVFVRHGRHDIYRIYGIQVTITGTRTDVRGWKNNLAEIRRAQKTWRQDDENQRHLLLIRKL